MENHFDQSPFQCCMDWGPEGVRKASERGDIIIIVDVLSFSSTVIAALHFGAVIYPFSDRQTANGLSNLIGAEILPSRKEGKKIGVPSLSPTSFNSGCRDKKFILCSPNGATCAKISGNIPNLFLGSLVNAAYTAEVADELQKGVNSDITVIACGERWDKVDALRPCIEDYLGAGAILNLLHGTKSPEAEVCVAAFKNSVKQLKKLIWDSGSGRELREKGFSDDAIFSSRLNVFEEVPILVRDNLEKSYFKNFSA